MSALSSSNPCNTGSTIDSVFYRGSRRDIVTGDYQFGVRTYDPNTGSFLEPDTYLGSRPGTRGSVVSDPLTMNRYVYVNGDPLNLIDPSGHMDIVNDSGATTSTQTFSTAAASTPYVDNNSPASSNNYGIGAILLSSVPLAQFASCRRTLGCLGGTLLSGGVNPGPGIDNIRDQIIDWLSKHGGPVIGPFAKFFGRSYGVTGAITTLDDCVNKFADLRDKNDRVGGTTMCFVDHAIIAPLITGAAATYAIVQCAKYGALMAAACALVAGALTAIGSNWLFDRVDDFNHDFWKKKEEGCNSYNLTC